MIKSIIAIYHLFLNHIWWILISTILITVIAYLYIDKEDRYHSQVTYSIDYQQYRPGDNFLYDGKIYTLRRENFHLANQVSWQYSVDRFVIMSSSNYVISQFLCQPVTFDQRTDLLINHYLEYFFPEESYRFSEDIAGYTNMTRASEEELVELVQHFKDKVIRYDIPESKTVIHIYLQTPDPEFTLFLKSQFIAKIERTFYEEIDIYKSYFDGLKERKKVIRKELEGADALVAQEEDKTRNSSSEQSLATLQQYKRRQDDAYFDYYNTIQHIDLLTFLEGMKDDKFVIESNQAWVSTLPSRWQRKLAMIAGVGFVLTTFSTLGYVHLKDVLSE